MRDRQHTRADSAESYCEACAPDGFEADHSPGETDAPEHCEGCGRPLDYSLTPEGVAYVISELRDALRPHVRANLWGQVWDREPGQWYAETSYPAVLLDWARDLTDYHLPAKQKAIVDTFIRAAEPVCEPKGGTR